MAMTRRTRILFSFAILSTGIFVSYFMIAYAQSENAPGITYPIQALGNCKDKNACHTYCEEKNHIAACVAFAETHNLISADDAARAKAFAAQESGPGGCTSKNECEAYCNDQSHMDACLTFAAQHRLVSEDELRDAQKIANALKAGAHLPGDCKNKRGCESYCNDMSHIHECVGFAEQSGILPPNELKEAKQVAAALAQGAQLPGNCREKKECDAYCSDGSHIDECFVFAEKAGFLSPQEIADAKKVIPLMKNGETPGRCKTKEECRSYCADTSHLDECASFGLKAGFLTQEEYAMYKKTGGRGPGGCTSKDECEAYCNNPANRQTCFSFAEDKGLIPPEKIQEMKQGMTRLKEGLTQAPPEAIDCLKQAIGTDNFEKIKNGTLTPGPEIGDQIKSCFEKFMQGKMKGYEGRESQERMRMPPRDAIPEKFKNRGTPPTKEEIQKMIEEKKAEMMQRQGTGQYPQDVLGGYKNQMPGDMPKRESMPQGMPPQGGSMPTPGQGFENGLPSAEQIQEQIQKMMPQNIGPQNIPGQTPPTQ